MAIDDVPPAVATADSTPPVDPVVEAFKKHVDMTLIREQRRRTVDERVARMIGALRLADQLRRGRERGRQ